MGMKSPLYVCKGHTKMTRLRGEGAPLGYEDENSENTPDSLSKPASEFALGGPAAGKAAIETEPFCELILSGAFCMGFPTRAANGSAGISQPASSLPAA